MPFAYYQRLSAQQKRIYRASDRVDRIHLPRTDATRGLGELLVALEGALGAGDRAATERAAQGLIDRLTGALEVPRLRIRVLRRRPSWETGELHGLYEPAESGIHRVSVWMRTAQRAQVVKFKTFLRTLLHELCHHLDYERLQLEESFHTEGFYKRESSLVRELFAFRLPAGPPQSEPAPPLAATSRRARKRGAGSESLGS